MRKKLYISQLDDPYLENNFNILGDLFRSIPFLKGEWRFIEFTVKTTGTQKIPHGLNFRPKDVLVTSVIGGTIVFNYSDFDSTFLDVTATVSSSPMAVRALIGSYSEDSVNV